MNNYLPISLVMSSIDYNRWVNDKNSFVRVFVHSDRTVSYIMMTYEELWSECLRNMDDGSRFELAGYRGELFDNFKNELLADYMMRTDTYSYQDYMNSDSFEPYIWVNRIESKNYYVIVFGDYRDDNSMIG